MCAFREYPATGRTHADRAAPGTRSGRGRPPRHRPLVNPLARALAAPLTGNEGVPVPISARQQGYRGSTPRPGSPQAGGSSSVGVRGMGM
jgi:hypothetical protein